MDKYNLSKEIMNELGLKIKESINYQDKAPKNFKKYNDRINTNTYLKETENKKRVITEKDILNIEPNRKRLTVPKGTIITSLAIDRAKELKIEIIKI